MKFKSVLKKKIIKNVLRPLDAVCKSSVSVGQPGLSIIELLITLGIVTIMAAGATVLYTGLLNSHTLSDATDGIAITLRHAGVRAFAGDNNSNWGVHFVNNATNPDYYQLFFGASFAAGTVISTTYISSKVQFSDPASGASKDIIFTQTTGAPTATSSVTIQLTGSTDTTKTISVNSLGLVSY